MLEKEIERLFKLCEQNTIGKSEGTTVKDILAAEIPYPVKVFFRADVERMLHDEIKRERANSRFNYSHREVDNLQQQLSSLLVLNFTFRREEFLQKLEDGIHLIMNYLFRPQWTLTNFLFTPNASILAPDLKQMLSYFGAYEYLKAVLVRYIDEKNVGSITLAEFQNLLWRIDVEYVRRKSPMELTRLTTPIYDFVHFVPYPTATSTTKQPLPTKALAKFFEDKRLKAICEMIERRRTDQKGEGMSYDDLQAFLDEVYRTSPNAFWPEEDFIKKQAPLAAGPEPALSAQGELRVEEQIYEPEEPLLDIKELISDEEHKRFLKKIFRKDDGYYVSSLEALNTIGSWKEASVFIDKILIANDVDPYCNEAVRFSELVYQRFFPKTRR